MPKKFRLYLNKTPRIIANAVNPGYDKKTQKRKNRKQFLNEYACILSVYYDDMTVTITAPDNYLFDGATIPFNIGKGNMKLLVPALFHDVMCDKKEVVNFDRNLSSRIFKELLKMCGIPKWKAQLMYLAVDNYQRLNKEWRNKKC